MCNDPQAEVCLRVLLLLVFQFVFTLAFIPASSQQAAVRFYAYKIVIFFGYLSIIISVGAIEYPAIAS